MASSCLNHPPRHARRGRSLSLALFCLGGLALLFNASVVAHAQTPTPTPTPSSADLTVSKSGNESAPVGGTTTYDLVVSNSGPGAVTAKSSPGRGK